MINFNRKMLYVLLVLGFVVLVVFLNNKNKGTEDGVTAPVAEETYSIELCFGKFGQVSEQGFSDKYTLRMLLAGEKVSGELNFLPAEKDSKVGVFEGVVGPVDKMMMARTVNAWWDTMAEGMNTKEELKIVFGEGTASIVMGEMMDRGDGVYVYKDPEAASYGLELTDIACSELDVRKSVEEYLQKNIGTLSPVSPVLGGAWYVLGVSVDVREASGVVVYEDGHILEKRNFSYTLDEKNEIVELKIK